MVQPHARPEHAIMGVRIMGHWAVSLSDFRCRGRDTSVGGTRCILNRIGADEGVTDEGHIRVDLSESCSTMVCNVTAKGATRADDVARSRRMQHRP